MLWAIPVIASHSDMSQQFSSPKRAQQAIPFGVVVAFMLLAQILMAVPIWNNNVAPEDAVFLGRYTRGYTLVLFANLGLIAIWAILFWQRARFERFLTWIPSIWHYVLIALGLIPVIGLWLFSENDRLIQYATINWVIIAFVLMLTVPDRALRPRWLWLVFAGVLVLLIPLIWSAITGKASFAPHDEAVWADFATSIFHTGGIHFRTFLQDYPVQPGWGIVAVPYGWLLENVAFDGRIGRVIVQIMYLLAFLGIGLVGKYLYNWKVAIVSVALAILSQNFIVLNEFRSHHYMPR